MGPTVPPTSFMDKLPELMGSQFYIIKVGVMPTFMISVRTKADLGEVPETYVILIT